MSDESHIVLAITDEHPEGTPVVPAWYHAARIRELEGERNGLRAEREALAVCIEHLESERDTLREQLRVAREERDDAVTALTEAYDAGVDAGLESEQPCGECHLQPGERCDICGRKALEQIGGGDE